MMSPHTERTDQNAQTPGVRDGETGFRIRDEETSQRSRRRRKKEGHVLMRTDTVDPRDRVMAALDMLRDQLKTHPYRTLGIALGLGFTIGGGLSTRLGRMALLAAMRSVGNQWLKTML